MGELVLEDFSGGYYRAEMVVQPYSGGPVIEQSLYNFIEREFYQDSDMRPVFKFDLDGGPHFKPSHESSVPPDVLAIPEEWFSEFEIDEQHTSTSVFIVKPNQSHYLRAAFGGQLSTEDDDEHRETT